MKDKMVCKEVFKEGDFTSIIESLQQMADNPKKYRLLEWDWFREVIEDSLETYLNGNMFICYKSGPIIDIHLRIAVKDKKTKRKT